MSTGRSVPGGWPWNHIPELRITCLLFIHNVHNHSCNCNDTKTQDEKLMAWWRIWSKEFLMKEGRNSWCCATVKSSCRHPLIKFIKWSVFLTNEVKCFCQSTAMQSISVKKNLLFWINIILTGPPIPPVLWFRCHQTHWWNWKHWRREVLNVFFFFSFCNLRTQIFYFQQWPNGTGEIYAQNEIGALQKLRWSIVQEIQDPQLTLSVTDLGFPMGRQP